jgi:hypothetical protein
MSLKDLIGLAYIFFLGSFLQLVFDGIRYHSFIGLSRSYVSSHEFHMLTQFCPGQYFFIFYYFFFFMILLN